MVFAKPELGFALPVTSGALDRLLVAPNALDFDASECSRELVGQVDAARRDGLVPVLSSERLSGDETRGGWDAAALAARIAACLPEARIVIVVREQQQLITSVYKAYVAAGGVRPARRFMAPEVISELPTFKPAHFAFDRLVDRYAGLLGPSRVLVLPFEQLREDPGAFVGRLLEFAGASTAGKLLDDLRYDERTESEPSALTANLVRWWRSPRGDYRLARLMALLPFWRLRPRRKAPAGTRGRQLDRAIPLWIKRPFEARLARAVRVTTGDAYRGSNLRLARLTGLNLASYGYELPPR
jgi:hypothetical protein